MYNLKQIVKLKPAVGKKKKEKKRKKKICWITVILNFVACCTFLYKVNKFGY